MAATQGRPCVEGKREALYPHEEVMHLMACLGPVTRPTRMSYIQVGSIGSGNQDLRQGSLRLKISTEKTRLSQPLSEATLSNTV